MVAEGLASATEWPESAGRAELAAGQRPVSGALVKPCACVPVVRPVSVPVARLTHLAAAGRTIAILPRSLVEPVPAGLVCVPATDAPTRRRVIAWSPLDRRPLVASCVDAVIAASASRA
jgi:DNA-binding transcriptional LysR family regulator